MEENINKDILKKEVELEKRIIEIEKLIKKCPKIFHEEVKRSSKLLIFLKGIFKLWFSGLIVFLLVVLISFTILNFII
ncbi:MAG: hypothetical protein AD073_000241 [Mycoplasmataceae bacterium]|nr:MAG: hypothetical protein AD073_000241 [Mycoplasmataceae bacterium]